VLILKMVRDGYLDHFLLLGLLGRHTLGLTRRKVPGAVWLKTADCKKKAGASSRTPNEVFYKVNYKRRFRKVRKNCEELPATTNPGEDLLSDNPAGKEKARILLLARSGSLVSRGEFPAAHRTMGRIS
jgi:hypothetical protein